jgi:hypothetical protein
MAQMAPNYPFMTSQVNDIFVKPLIGKYGFANVVWPIAIIKEEKIASYIYELSDICKINDNKDSRPTSKSGIGNYFVDYANSPRSISPAIKGLEPLIEEKYSCSYEFVLQSNVYSSVDIDYAWFNKDNWKAVELTTVFMPLTSQKEAERLVGMFNRRPSWKGQNGPHAIRKLIDASNDLNLDYYMVVVNSEKGVSNQLVTTGNAFWFKLNHANIDRILAGQAPNESTFGSFNDLINWL